MIEILFSTKPSKTQATLSMREFWCQTDKKKKPTSLIRGGEGGKGLDPWPSPRDGCCYPALELTQVDTTASEKNINYDKWTVRAQTKAILKDGKKRMKKS